MVGVTADRRWAEQAELLERRGAEVVHGPTISTAYLGSDDTLRRATEAVIAARPDYLVATTGIGMRAWFEVAETWDLAERLRDALASTRVAARGAKAAATVQAVGLALWSVPDSERLTDLVTQLLTEPLAGRTVAFQHYGERDAAAVERLVGAGAVVVEVPIYRWRLPDDVAPAERLVDAICRGAIDAVTFTSAPAIQHLVTIADLTGRATALLDAFNDRGVVAACVGPVCADGARRAGILDPVAPPRGRMGLLVRSVSDALCQRAQHLVLAGTDVTVQGGRLCVEGVAVDLPPRERAVLQVLLSRRGVVVPKPALLKAVWDDDGNDHALEAAVGRLRARLGAGGGAIRAVRARGYLLEAETA